MSIKDTIKIAVTKEARGYTIRQSAIEFGCKDVMYNCRDYKDMEETLKKLVEREVEQILSHYSGYDEDEF